MGLLWRSAGKGGWTKGEKKILVHGGIKDLGEKEYFISLSRQSDATGKKIEPNARR